jgi:uncharacterized membrane protein
VLAFAVTLLVVSLDVPHTFDELLHTMRGFPAFAICFSILIWVWYWQYVFFRRYGLQDRITLASMRRCSSSSSSTSTRSSSCSPSRWAA